MHRKALFLASTAAFLGATPAAAQDSNPADIIVTARRVEERLQDVPISITVLNQQALTNRNISSTADLGSYVPSLATNQQFGPEKSSFAIRGFTQEAKTAPSVAVYFADVVAPRAFGPTTSGNGAGVGSLFDLQNLQVLKGPQGTLFGRNTTGGAILLVPVKPQDSLGGFIEGSLGNYGMHRVQAVINAPLSETFRVRGGVDWHENDGYLNNIGVGPSRMGNTNYVAARMSIVGDLTPDLENYTIASFSRSNTRGVTPKILACTPAPNNPVTAPLGTLLNPFACAQIARENASNTGFWTVENSIANPRETIEQWQVINTTTLQASDALTIKNIASYGEFREKAAYSLFGDYFLFPSGPAAGRLFTQAITNAPGVSGYQAAQSTFTEELQFQGEAAGGRLTWQAGAYLEISKPLKFNSSLSGLFLNCTDITTANCTNPLGFGSIGDARTKTFFNNKGLYAQGTFRVTPKLSVTAGIRYTIDQMRDVSENTTLSVSAPGVTTRYCTNRVKFNGGNLQTPLVVTDPARCRSIFELKSERPTWLIGLDFKPVDDVLLYAKWARGYRQGSINSNNLGLETVQPESVDTYEIGAKTAWRGTMPGFFNVAAFYNDFRDQQLAVNSVVAAAFVGAVPPAQPIVNAGKSRIWGIEVDASISPFRGFTLEGSYAYLNTKLESFTAPSPLPVYYVSLLPAAAVGGPLALSPRNRYTITGTYRVPVDQVGVLSIGATFTHTDANRVVNPAISPNFSDLSPSNLLNVNASWESIFDTSFDLAFFMTNVTNEKRSVYTTAVLSTLGGEGGYLNQPRMWGFRLKYRFGQ